MFAPHQHDAVILSDIGILLWLGAITMSIYTYGFATVFRLYLAPYLWYVHYLISPSWLLIFEQGSTTGWF